METLSDFFASAVEFLVGGVLFVISVAFLVSAGFTPPNLTELQRELLSGYETLITLVFVALAYAMGVVAESLARSSFEFLLDRVTVRTEAFLPGGDGPVIAQGSVPVRGSAWRNRINAWWKWVIELGLGGDYTVHHRYLARKERERQRMTVMTRETLHTEVQGQLKRLRLERVSSLCFAIVAFSLMFRGQWQYAALVSACTAGMIWIVNSRFRRFCGAIVRTYDVVAQENLQQVPQGLSANGA
ncbi:MAG: hypothetical protein ABI903_01680 [Actinomycetota bacterium]